MKVSESIKTQIELYTTYQRHANKSLATINNWAKQNGLNVKIIKDVIDSNLDKGGNPDKDKVIRYLEKINKSIFYG